ncbi:MAG: hypothetical protein U5K54_04430 [Cytophagales bacterium]|nr:hypothetical protein [Cytophagales bacterium]
MEQMRATLAPAVFKKVSNAIKNHEKIDETTADAVSLRPPSRGPSPKGQLILHIGFNP